MKITTLLEMKAEERPVRIYGVECDDYLDVPLVGVQEIGLLVEVEGTTIAFDVLDTAIALSEEGDCKVLLEVPFEANIASKEVIISAMNTGCDVSLLPPSESTEENWDKFADKMVDYCKAWFAQSRNERMVYPVAGYLQYLIMAENGYVPDSIATDSYMKENYVDDIEIRIMDKAKDKLRETIFDCFGGHDEFKTYVSSLNVAVAQNLVSGV